MSSDLLLGRTRYPVEDPIHRGIVIIDLGSQLRGFERTRLGERRGEFAEAYAILFSGNDRGCTDAASRSEDAV